MAWDTAGHALWLVELQGLAPLDLGLLGFVEWIASAAKLILAGALLVFLLDAAKAILPSLLPLIQTSHTSMTVKCEGNFS